jgi:hypothetical protein
MIINHGGVENGIESLHPRTTTTLRADRLIPVPGRAEIAIFTQFSVLLVYCML